VGTLYFRIIHKRKIKQIHTGLKVNTDEWDNASGKFLPANDSRREYISDVQSKVAAMQTRIEQIIAILDGIGSEYTADDVAERYFDHESVVGIISYIQSIINEHRKLGLNSAVNHYTSLRNSLIRFRNNEEIPFDAVDEQLVRNYENHLKADKLCPNSTSYYMRKLRRVYNLAVERGLAPERNPFKPAYTGVAKTVKRAVSIETLKKLKKLDLSGCYNDALARDMFLFSFYTRGMSMIDMCFLRKKDLRDGFLTYRRSKTKQPLTIKWKEKMAEIVARYDNPDSPYLLPLIKTHGTDEYRQYLNASHLLNRHLNEIGRKLGMDTPLTMYRARHTWASAALDNNVPVSVISQGMGHDSEKTTRIYLASIDRSKVDKANDELIDMLDD